MYNTFIEESNTFGRKIHVFEKEVFRSIGGGEIAKAVMPDMNNVLQIGTPILLDEDARTIVPHYSFKVKSVASNVVQVYKLHGNTTAKVGMFLMEAPDSVEDTATAVTISAIDSSNEEYDELTLSAAISGLAVNDILLEANQTGAGATIKVLPKGLLAADVPHIPNAIKFTGANAWGSNGIVYARRIPAIAPCIAKYMRENDCFFRFSQSKA